MSTGVTHLREPLITTRIVSELTGLTTRKILRAVESGDLPHYRLSLKVLRY